MGLFDRLRGKGKSSAETALVYALSTTTGSGPSDGLNGRDGKPYWVSTLRYPAGHWQTAVFDHSAQDSLDHPLFLINTTTHPGDALQNHLAALILVAESPRPEWPTGMHSEPCNDPSWRRALDMVSARIQQTTEGPIETYIYLRNQYHAKP